MDQWILVFEPSEDIGRETEYTGSPALIFGFFSTEADARDQGAELKKEYPHANIYTAKTGSWVTK